MIIFTEQCEISSLTFLMQRVSVLFCGEIFLARYFTINIFIFLKILFVYLRSEETKRKVDRKEFSFSLIHPPNAFSGWAWDMLNPGGRNSNWVSHMGGQDPST